ncbi:ABC transporter ATP-binding protein [Candidatus Saccharibacteria bacterium]|nr:ABC transporter ATP-binding protein [Candidatus Saccharibacteria bacterium]
MAKKIAIEVKNVRKTFYPNVGSSTVKNLLLDVAKKKHTKHGSEGHEVLKGVSLTVEDGEFLGIVGRNGSGKSTLLKILASIYKPDKGSIAIHGSLIPFIELGVGFNPQLSGHDNIYLNGAMLGFSRKEIDKMYDEIVAFAELQDSIHEKLKNYSSGMQVRLAFSIAVKADSDILLLDEVLAVGDESFQQKCLREFRRFKSEKKTIILVTHSMDYIEKFCDRAILIHDGEVIDEGKPEDVAFHYKKINVENTAKTAADNEVTNKETGNRKVLVTDMKMSAVDNILQTGDKIQFTIDYQKHSPDVTHMNVALGIYHVEGPYVTGVDTVTDKVKTIKVKDSGRIVLGFDELNLLGGEYLVNVALFEDDREDPLHFIRSICQFNVVDRDNRRGLVYMPHKWRINE